MFHNIFAIAIAISPMVTADMPPPLLNIPSHSGGLSADVVSTVGRSVTLSGPAELMQAINHCVYHPVVQPVGGRSAYQFMIEWGDGTIFTVTDGPAGTSCTDRATHQYRTPGEYTISVSITATAANDGFLQIYAGSTSVSF